MAWLTRQRKPEAAASAGIAWHLAGECLQRMGDLAMSMGCDLELNISIASQAVACSGL